MNRYLSWALLSVVSGILAGISAAILLLTLDWATRFRDAHSVLLWGLPFAGVFIAVLYRIYGKEVAAGTNLILEEIHDPEKILPLRMAPLVYCGTILTHLFGGSAGREGTAVQMGASLSDQLSHVFKIEPMERKILLTAGAGAGFSAAIGAPWAGALFGMEVLQIGRLNPFAIFECTIASFTAYSMANFLQAPHSHFPIPEIPSASLALFFGICVAGISFGQAAHLFSFTTHKLEFVFEKFISKGIFRPFVGGILLLAFFHGEGSMRYVGLGINEIQESFLAPSPYRDSLFKLFSSTLTIASGFKGGEFIPLVFVGATLGSALSTLLPISFGLLSALGFSAVFAGASNTPIACTVMAMELFGFRIAPYAFLACYISYLTSGHKGIYKTQRIQQKKDHIFSHFFGWLAQIPRRF